MAFTNPAPPDTPSPQSLSCRVRNAISELRPAEVVTILFTIISGLLSILAYLFQHHQEIAADISQVINVPSDDIIPWTLLIQTVAIFCLIGFRRLVPALSNDSKFQTAVAATKQFERWWFLIWIAWLGLYITWSLEHWIQFNNVATIYVLHFLGDLFNLLSGGFFLICYLVMVLHTVPPKQYVWWFRCVFIVIVVCVLIATGEFVTVLALSKHIQSREQALAELHAPTIDIFHNIEGLLVGLATALFVGRLESPLLPTKKWVVVLFYIYAVMQVTYPAIEQGTPHLTTMFLTLALFFKVLMYWCVGVFISRGDMTYYMFKYRETVEAEPIDKRQFLEGLFQ